MSRDKAGRSLTPKITELSITQMIEGIDRSLPGLLMFLAIWLGGTIRIERWSHVVYSQPAGFHRWHSSASLTFNLQSTNGTLPEGSQPARYDDFTST
jgi:hypothetical protein